MPEGNYTAALKEAFASATKNIPVLETVEISHPTGGTYYLVNNKEDLTLTDEDSNANLFEAVPFRLQRPKQGESGSQELSLTVDNVDRRIGLFIDKVKTSQVPTTIKHRIFLASNYAQPQTLAPMELTIVEASINAFEVTFRARFVDVLNRDFPNERYTTARFPGLGG